MSITYRQHQDTRDGQIYPCVLMPDGKWWSAENLAWTGAGYDYNNDPIWRPRYGRLYPVVGRETLPPPGARLPSNNEWADVVSSVGGTDPFLHLKDGSIGWDTYNGDNSTGMSLRGGGVGSQLSTGGPYFSNAKLYGYWLCSDDYYRHATSAGTALYGPLLATETDSAFSVRFIVDVFNEPIPPTKIKGTFSGSGVKVFCTNYNTPTFELPLSAQTTTELTIDKDFISFWGPSLGNVRILVVDGEYISDWKDWNFNA